MSSSSQLWSDHTTAPTSPDVEDAEERPCEPGLVLVWKPRDVRADDRTRLRSRLVVGRSSSCDWPIRDRSLSREHFELLPCGDGPIFVRDLESRNGLTLNGSAIEAEAEAAAGDVLRAGRCVFMVVEDLNRLAPPGIKSGSDEFAGRFYTQALVASLRVAAHTGLHIFLEGETGVGKELTARELRRIFGELDREGPLLTHNSAHFAGESDAVGTLFGVARGAFTDVEPRLGALVQADGGTLFLDEVHALPLRVQQSLLRFVEEGTLEPLGASKAKTVRVDTRLILGTNVDVERDCDQGKLANDLVERLYRVAVPPLRRRRADIPSIFERVLDTTIDPSIAGELKAAMTARTVERLCLHSYRRGNVRELVKIAAVAGAKTIEGAEPSRALAEAVDEILEKTSTKSARPRVAAPATNETPGSRYEQHRREIVEEFERTGGNLTRMVEALETRGVPCSRRWLSVYLDKWGVRPMPKRK